MSLLHHPHIFCDKKEPEWWTNKVLGKSKNLKKVFGKSMRNKSHSVTSAISPYRHERAYDLVGGALVTA